MHHLDPSSFSQLLASLGRSIGINDTIGEPVVISQNSSNAAVDVSSSAVGADAVKGKTKMSKRIPRWLWVVIAKSLGIKLHAKDSPGLASVLHLLTIAAGAGIDMCGIA